MKIAIGLGGTARRGLSQWDEIVELVCEAEGLGVDFVWSAEAWGQDAVTPLAYLAAKTRWIRLGTGILQISARAPAMTAMTALTLSGLSGGRFTLGLGVSGPQVVEGLHGTPYARPLGRMRETIDILRLAFRGEKIEYQGQHFQLPLPGGEGKPLRLALAPAAELPIYLATLAPRSLELTGELADGWLGTSFIPESADVFFSHIARGARSAGRSLADLDLQAGGWLEFGDDVEGIVARRRPGVAFTLGAMGSRRHNFYNDAYRRAGYEDEAREVQALWLDGKREEAAARVPDEMVLKSHLVGTEEMVRERIRRYRDAGVTTLRLNPGGETLHQRLETLARAVELVRQETTPAR